MPYGLYIAAEGAHAQSMRLEVVANNLANASTTGFKRDLALFQARFSEAVQNGMSPPGTGSINDIGGGVRVLATETDFSQGPLNNTGVDSDLAIQGDGYFVVQKDGRQLLTRAGNFTFNSNNKLVEPTGGLVLSDGGSPIEVDPEAGPWRFAPDGSFVQAGDSTPLALVVPKSPGDLAKLGGNMFLPLGRTVPIEPEQRQVATGMLEASTVKPTMEMTELIETTRAFEANVQIIRTYDTMIGNLISSVLKEG
jgi:flagellar basal-body rod protein FlgF/flagellar basal-body rod protein FlgG